MQPAGTWRRASPGQTLAADLISSLSYSFGHGHSEGEVVDARNESPGAAGRMWAGLSPAASQFYHRAHSGLAVESKRKQGRSLGMEACSTAQPPAALA